MRQSSSQHTLDGTQGTLAELNITPLLDLAFVLLIIFMITAPFLAESADLIIPTSKASREAVDPAQVQVISVNAGKELSLGEEKINASELQARLRALHEEQPETAILIKAHNKLFVEDLVEVMDIAKNANITKIGVVTKPAE